MPKRDFNVPYWSQLREAEKRIVEYAMEHGRTVKRTAQLLGVKTSFLNLRVQVLGIVPPRDVDIARDRTANARAALAAKRAARMAQPGGSVVPFPTSPVDVEKGPEDGDLDDEFDDDDDDEDGDDEDGLELGEEEDANEDPPAA